MKTSIIILTHNQIEYTQHCIKSIRNYTSNLDYEVIVIDNQSTDGTVDWLKQQTDLIVHYNLENVGFPKGCNQGINMASGENILLLNNDVIVTENWLDNLLAALYSDEKIGAVGPVTNSAAYYTSIPVTYTTIDEMHIFSKGFNVSNPNLWEERLKLIGFCLLFKRTALDEVGVLDERFTPGNFEDDDISIRLRKSGYTLLLCQDTFIHHYGSVSWKENLNNYSSILSTNEQLFMNKWGTNSSSYLIDLDLIEAINVTTNEPLNVLHIGCRSGGTLLKIKNSYKSANLYGIEKSIFEANEAKLVAKVNVDEPSNALSEYPDNFFDVILMSDSEKFEEIEVLVPDIKKKLKDNGVYITKLSNISFYPNIKNILSGGKPLYGNRFFSYQEVFDLFSDEEADFDITLLKSELNERARTEIKVYSEFGDANTQILMETAQFLVRVKTQNHVKQLIKDIFEGYATEANLQVINSKSVEELINSFDDNENTVNFLNLLAIKNLELQKYEFVLPYLNAAHHIDKNDADTIYNLAYVLNLFGDNRKAMEYLEKLTNMDEEIQSLYQVLYEKTAGLKNIVRRIEFSIEVDESVQEVLISIRDGKISEDDLMNVINNDIINKQSVLNILAVSFYKEKNIELCLSLLEKSYKLDPKDEDTLFNLGHILWTLKENRLALHYFSQIENRDLEIASAIEDIQKELQTT
ncbi:glycosyl transferase [Bacillus canaveralius]|uniref:Glycosyl transferase n=1 Tax=Bacillus canaveralius TaxID=1403243 RepID=A0A2N5GMK3_9BACI|nr:MULTISPECIES: glycosyltransferase [Bacillus]PLR82577.1 glycosyl transferase [Bacillus sp. V33-4]PLR83164.1 glycosyl transferase [Bacillus canaveralius]PLR94082.1 glycosyl transferase [Bacillus canaveralius]RSK54117.1 glycosyltransferase [Bacillus canaveralius]